MTDNLPWFRFYSEVATDIKFNVAARLAGVSKLEIIGAWTLLLCAANASPVRGALYVTLHDRYSNGDVTELLRCSNDQTENIINALVKLDMLEDNDGEISIKNWGKRQFLSDNSAKRVQKHRENVTRPLHDRYKTVTVTPPESDTDTESDTELNNNNNSDFRKFFDTYLEEMHLAETQVYPQKAVDAFDRMQKLGATPDDMRQAIREMLASKYTITSPQSVVNWTSNIMSRRLAAKPPSGNGNGRSRNEPPNYQELPDL
jgi:hypothetical protein